MVDSKTAKTSRARRFLRNREAKLNENPKTALLVRGQKTSGLINSILIDLFMLKKPHSALLLRVEHAATLVPGRGTHPTDRLCAAAAGVHLRRHNAVHPFEDATPMEFLSQKNDASLFAFGTHSKKRPHNLVFGRLFDNHILDMVETGVAGAWPPPIHPELPRSAPSSAKPTRSASPPARSADPRLPLSACQPLSRWPSSPSREAAAASSRSRASSSAERRGSRPIAARLNPNPHPEDDAR